MNIDYYQNKNLAYGIGHTRLRRILDLAEDVSGRRILDVGCGSGKLGAEFKKRGAYAVGSDISPVAVKEAKARLDEVFLVQSEDVLPRNTSQGQFDLIILAEILEHVFDPVAMLIKANKFLKSGGHFIITTPNFMVWTNRLKFLLGKFTYQSEGMFDFGHIRWFSHSYLKEVFKEAGLKVVAEKHIIFPGKLTRLLKKWPAIFAWQFIVKVKKI